MREKTYHQWKETVLMIEKNFLGYLDDVTPLIGFVHYLTDFYWENGTRHVEHVFGECEKIVELRVISTFSSNIWLSFAGDIEPRIDDPRLFWYGYVITTIQKVFKW